ncbi:MAG TPA: hypothetical protein VFG49_17450 [Dyella sp.]|uniref:hypothetical protein n=1 Tax=Dyella sp. TaxID=1869338 RepID=UPI002D788317|nr:hypothetical protein [Dyella sp.]HET6555316.1 hypothetical protein [Dyella sp.]
MKWSSTCCWMVAVLLAADARAADGPVDLSLPAAKGAAASTYRVPLAGAARYGVAPTLLPVANAPAVQGLPAMPVNPSALERATGKALDVAGTAAVMRAAEKRGTGTAVSPPSYAPYRPNLPMPEPGAEPVNCQPNGSLTAPAMCPGR